MNDVKTKTNLLPTRWPDNILGKVKVDTSKLQASKTRGEIPFEFFYNLGKQLDEAGLVEKMISKKNPNVVTKYFPWSTLHIVLKLFYGDGYQRLHQHFGEDAKPYQFHQEVSLTDPSVLRVQVFTVTEGFSINGKEFWLTQPLQGFNYKTQPYTYYGKEVVFAQQRTFAKAVAINTGLGLHLWEKEDIPTPSTPLVTQPLTQPEPKRYMVPKPVGFNTIPKPQPIGSSVTPPPPAKNVVIDVPEKSKRKELW